MVGIKPHNFVCEYPKTICWEDQYFPHWIVLALLWKINWPQINWGYISGFLSLFHWFAYLSIYHCLDYCSFVVSFEIENYESSKFALLFSKLFWLFWVPCISMWIVGSACQFLQKIPAEILICIVLNLLINLENIAILTIFSLLILEYGMSSHLFRS